MFPFIYPLENLWFSDVFRGIKREHWPEIGKARWWRNPRFSDIYREKKRVNSLQLVLILSEIWRQAIRLLGEEVY